MPITKVHSAINPLALILILTLPCSGCSREKTCSFVQQSTSTAPVVSDGFGVNIDFTDPQLGEMKMLSEGGFSWVRMDFVWASTEKERGHYDFSAYDRLLAAEQPYNIHTLFILDYGNPLYDNGAPPRTEATRQAFARWAVAAARHFAGRGAIWEVYNEPNQPTFWPPQPNAQEYVALALAVGRAFRASVPDEKLIGPATSEIDFGFVETCFKAGLLEYWWAVSVHPYRRSDPETVARDYCRLRDLIRIYAPLKTGGGPESAVGQPRQGGGTDSSRHTKEIGIISSEWGYSSVWRDLSEEKQGQLLARTWLTNVGNGVSLSIWYDWRDDGLNPLEPEHHFGTVFNSYHENRDPIYDPKPTYLAAKSLTAFLSGYRFEKRLDVGSEEDYVLAFRNGDKLRFAAWTTSHAHTVLVPISAARYTCIRHTGEQLGTFSGDQKGLAITLTNDPIYLR
jgi:hypothetical protein